MWNGKDLLLYKFLCSDLVCFFFVKKELGDYKIVWEKNLSFYEYWGFWELNYRFLM